MRPDVSELSDFYHGPLGSVARRLLAHRIRSIWGDVSRETIVGLGYAAPFMRQFLSEARRLLLCMPQEQGAVRWPPEGPVCSFLGSETELPLAASSAERVLAVHCLEHSGDARPLLREIWRILTPEGRLLLVVPNRRGVWARMDTTPFGQGHPYSRGQLQRLLADCLYQPTGWWPALFVPPFNLRVVMNTAVAWERIGLYGWPAFSGVLIVEAQKQVYAPITGRRAPVRSKLQTAPGQLAALGHAQRAAVPRHHGNRPKDSDQGPHLYSKCINF